ncbi:MAG: SCO family protein [Bdellovibrionota bacterium]
MKKLSSAQHFKVFVAVSLAASSFAFAENANAPWKQVGAVSNEVPRELENVGIKEQNGATVDPGLIFTDDTGKKVTLGDYYNKDKPIILSLVYFNCPSLCNMHLNGLNDGLKGLDWAVGDKFEVLSVSIEPKEDYKLAAGKKESYIEAYGRKESASGWHFLTGEDSQIKALAKQVGFGYKWDEASQQYAHSSAAIVLTPEGKISRYLHGISFDPKTIRLSMVEASSGKIGEIVDHLVLMCFKYDPNKRTYAFYAFNIMKYGAAICLLIFLAFLIPNWRRMLKESK